MNINVALPQALAAHLQADLEPEQAAQLSLLPAWRAEAADLLLRGVSYFITVRRLAGPLVQEMKRDYGTRLATACAQFKNIHKANGKDANMLLHSIPRGVLTSILLGTVAYDHENTGLVQYNADGGGVYVVGISLGNHKGAFLTAAEMDTFVVALGLYIDEAEAWVDADDDAKPTCTDVMVQTDNQYGIYQEPKPRFINTRSALNTMRQFLESMKLRLQSMEDADPSRTRRSHQSPLYVGCGVNVKKRVEAYKAIQSKTAWEESNNPLGLTMSLLHMANLNPKVHIVTVIRTWQPRQIGPAEGLVAALAGSYIGQQGFNIQICGQHSTEPSDDILADAATYVLLKSPHLTENVEASTRAVATLRNIAQTIGETDAELDNFDDMDVDDMVQSIEELKEACRKLAERVNEIKSSLTRAAQVEDVESLEDACDQARIRRQLHEDILKASKQLKGLGDED